VGFGISKPEHVRAVVRAGADGVIVGSRIVEEVPDVKRIAAKCRELRSSVDFPQLRHRAAGGGNRNLRGTMPRLRKNI